MSFLSYAIKYDLLTIHFLPKRGNNVVKYILFHRLRFLMQPKYRFTQQCVERSLHLSATWSKYFDGYRKHFFVLVSRVIFLLTCTSGKKLICQNKSSISNIIL